MGQGAYIFGCEATRLTEPEKAFFNRAQPFGFILFARNIDTPEQVRALCRELRECVDHPAPILIDQEGGRVNRLNPEHWSGWLPALDQVEKAGDNAQRSMWLRSRLIADDLFSIGIDCNCVPLADVLTSDSHPVLRNRCYGDDPVTVTRIARAVADGTMAGGVLPVLKHIPGYGRARDDAHLKLSVVDASLGVLKATDFAPFRALCDLPMAMTAHLIYSVLDSRPATQSKVIVDMIRDQLGFGGLLMGDDIAMEALDGDLITRSRLSLDAGCDIVLHCNGELAEMISLANNVGMMNPVSQTRADHALAQRREPEPFDRTEAMLELEQLLSGPSNG